VGLLALSLLAAGCSGQKIKEKPLTPEELNLQKFGRLCREYRARQGKAPADAEQLKSWAKQQKQDAISKMGIDDLEKVLVSPRDNQPYVLVRLPMGQGPVMAHEKTGVGGKRLVLSSGGSVYELGEEEFQKTVLQSTPGGRPGQRPGRGGRPGGSG
jgi:hypothetical protein